MAEISGGERLEAHLRKIAAKLSKGGLLKVGFLEGATYPDGTSVATVAAIQNYGAPSRGIPPRPFFSNMVEEKSGDWGDSLAAILKENDYDVTKSLELMGKGIEGQLRESIVNTNSPPLAEKTIARKGFAKPLIDTSNMINSVDSEVTGT
jgi:hypothetical protein